jgi:hypothetical protein
MKNCKYCAERPVMILDRYRQPYEYRVICPECGRTTTTSFCTEQTARRAWDIEQERDDDL